MMPRVITDSSSVREERRHGYSMQSKCIYWLKTQLRSSKTNAKVTCTLISIVVEETELDLVQLKGLALVRLLRFRCDGDE